MAEAKNKASRNGEDLVNICDVFERRRVLRRQSTEIMIMTQEKRVNRFSGGELMILSI